MKDLFEREAEILKHAIEYGDICAEQNECCSLAEYVELTKEYRRLLKLLRRLTKVSDMTTVELNADKNKLMDKVLVDELTGIYNRRFFEENTKRLFEECMKHDMHLGVYMLDVDFFKQYNDTYGHSQGDECLRRIAGAINNCLSQEEGFVARYGGEEFVLIIPDIDEINMKRMAEDVLNSIKNLKMEHIKNGDKKIVTISIGGCCVKPYQYKDYKESVSIADKALYMSKQSGRDKYTLCEKED